MDEECYLQSQSGRHVRRVWVATQGQLLDGVLVLGVRLCPTWRARLAMPFGVTTQRQHTLPSPQTAIAVARSIAPVARSPSSSA